MNKSDLEEGTGRIKPLDEDLRRYLQNFFESDEYRPPSREDLLYMDNFNSFMGHCRRLIYDTLQLHLTKIEPVIDKNQVQFIIDAHGQTLTNKLGLLTGQSGGPLSEEGIEFAKSIVSPDSSGQVVITSDLARAIHHAIAKYFPDELVKKGLKELISKTPASLETNYGVINRDVQLKWVEYALELGIIPTPLLRAQFYGLMELFPEKGVGGNLKKLVTNVISDPKIGDVEGILYKLKDKQNRCFQLQAERFKQLGASEPEIKEMTDRISSALLRKIDPKYFMGANDGRQITEQRVDLSKRVDYLMNLLTYEGPLFELTLGKRIQLVSHSGTNDALFEYLHRYEKPEDIHLKKRPKADTRGESVIVKMYMPTRKITFHKPLLIEDRKKLVSILVNGASDGSIPSYRTFLRVLEEMVYLSQGSLDNGAFSTSFSGEGRTGYFTPEVYAPPPITSDIFCKPLVIKVEYLHKKSK